MVVKSIDLWSCGKILGTIHGAAGALAGIILVPLALLMEEPLEGPFGAIDSFYAAGTTFLLIPLVHGGAGLVIGIIMAGLYNLAAATIGGLELELAPRDRQQSPPLLD